MASCVFKSIQACTTKIYKKKYIASSAGAGFIQPWAACIFGIVDSAACYAMCELTVKLKIDDAFTVFGLHWTSGVLGVILTGFFFF